MKTVVSKLDKKKYYKTIAGFTTKADDRNSFIKGENYWVRNVDASDNVDSEKYCVIKGTFNCESDALAHALYSNAINRYNGTYHFRLIVLKSVAKESLKYCD
mgnify:CR=1 FL=1